ncbi:MAG: type II toxin-antitoxin system RatA family toxin [Steroidobacteraceae bacterium]
MRNVKRSALVAAAPQKVFEMINDVERYPEFVPGCSAAEVLSRRPGEIVARLAVGKGPLSTAFTTRNRLEPDRRVTMELVEGPFKSLEGVWTLTPLGQEGGAAPVAGCRVELDLSFQPAGGLAGLALAPLIERMAGSLVDAFVQRARQQP